MNWCNGKILNNLLSVFLLLNMTGSVYAQVKIGNHPTTINKASVLELESDSLGLLLPRLKDTLLINSLNPPDGMIIYVNDASSVQHFYIHQYGFWVEVGNSFIQSLKGVNLTDGLKTDSVVTTLNGTLRKVSTDSLVMNSVNNSSSFNLVNGSKTDSVVTTLNGTLRKVAVDSLINNSVKMATGYIQPVQVIQAAAGLNDFAPAVAFTGETVVFADNEVKKFIFSVPGVKPGDVVIVNTGNDVSDAIFIAKVIVSAADSVEVTVINGTPIPVSSSVEMSIGLIRK
jgi:hypothetical protein